MTSTNISDAERREVAERLRGNPEDMLIPHRTGRHHGMGCREAADRFWNMCDRIKEAGNYDIAFSTTSVLSDLIEPQEITGETSDGYHTFDELYDHRAKLFSVIVRDHRELAWKSRLHHDGTMYDGMFIVGIETPGGQATYHYDVDPYWDLFDCKELDRAPEWDGHTPHQAIDRIAALEPSCDRDTPQKVAEEMFGKMRHSTKEEADAYDAMLKSMSVEIHPVDRDALLELAEKLDGLGLSGFSSGWSSGAVNVGFFARRIREALGVES